MPTNGAVTETVVGGAVVAAAGVYYRYKHRRAVVVWWPANKENGKQGKVRENTKK